MPYLSFIAWACIGLTGLWIIITYNSLVRKNKLAEEAWHGIDVQLKRRFDLVPALVETVKGYAGHERSTLEKIIALRSNINRTATISEQMQEETQLSQMLKSVFAIAENYPDLKANTNFLELQNQLNEIEDNLQNARRYYNATVRDYNILIALFPSNLIARAFKFKEKDFFSTENAQERQSVKVSF